MNSQLLRDAVAQAFLTTGADTPPWPDPHPGCQEPRQEEYSRCLDPSKYLILSARVDAWVEAVTHLALATVEEVGDPAEVWPEGLKVYPDRTIRVRPAKADAVPLLVGRRALMGVPGAVVTVGAGDPAVVLTSLPDCGCDACDDGSERLLEELDEYVLAVVSGELVHVTARHGTVVTTGSGWCASGWFADRRGGAEKVLEDARAGRSRHPVVHGAPWW